MFIMHKRRNARLTFSTAICVVIALFCVGYHAVQRVRLRRPLIEAVKRNDLAAVRSLLDAGADPNARDVAAPSFTWHEVVRAIIHPDAAFSSTEATALQIAAVARENEIARMLVERGGDVNATSSYWPEFAFSGIRNVPSEMTKIPVPVPRPPFPSYTALMDACANRESDLAQLLLERGADPNIHPLGGDTPLILALDGRSVDATGAGINDMVTQQTRTAAIVRMLLAHNADALGQSAVSVAMFNCWQCVLPLLQHGADVNTRSADPMGRTLTIEAAAENDAATTRFLAEHGADLNSTDSRNRTALMELCQRYTGELSIEALQALLDHGANPNLQDSQGNTALMEAAGVGKKDSFACGPNLEAIQILLQHGADPKLKDKSGKTVLDKLPLPAPQDSYGWKARRQLERAAGQTGPVTGTLPEHSSVSRRGRFVSLLFHRWRPARLDSPPQTESDE